MKDDLKDRIKDFAKQYSAAHFLSRETLLTQFIETELNVLKNQHVITDKDLFIMQDDAAKAWQSLPINSKYHGKPSYTLAYSWSKAVIQYLIRMGLLSNKVDIDQGESK